MLPDARVGARPNGTDDQVRRAEYQRDDDQLTDRHPKPRAAQGAEHSPYVNGDSYEGEHFLSIFQSKWAPMCVAGPIWCWPWRAPGPPAVTTSGAAPRIVKLRSPGRRQRRSARSATTASAWRRSRRASESPRLRCTATTRASTNCSGTRCSGWASSWWNARRSPVALQPTNRSRPCTKWWRHSSTPRWPTASRVGCTAGKAAISGAMTRPR